MKSPLLLILILFFSPFRAFSDTNSEALSRVWSIGKQRSCTKEMREAFSALNFKDLQSRLSSESDRTQLAKVLNPFLKKLGWSHTAFLTTEDETFYLLRGYSSRVSPEKPPAPLIINPGLQIGEDQKGYFAREILDGFPAQKAGLTKGDRILKWQGQPFSGTWGKRPSIGQVELERKGRRISIQIKTQELNWKDAFLEAMKSSVRTIPHNGKKLGYIRLWSGMNDDVESELAIIIADLGKRVDGIVLDLRGGYGGTWWEHLDPFFKSTNDYFVAEVVDGADVVETWRPEIKENPSAYNGPLAVLINEGSRSGKEAMAFQFKKSKRAQLFGTKTAGYFASGSYYFDDEPLDYLLYLCVGRITLDKQVIEGVGIAPDHVVPFEAVGEFSDSQLEAAVRFLVR